MGMGGSFAEMCVSKGPPSVVAHVEYPEDRSEFLNILKRQKLRGIDPKVGALVLRELLGMGKGGHRKGYPRCSLDGQTHPLKVSPRLSGLFFYHSLIAAEGFSQDQAHHLRDLPRFAKNTAQLTLVTKHSQHLPP